MVGVSYAAQSSSQSALAIAIGRVVKRNSSSCPCRTHMQQCCRHMLTIWDGLRVGSLCVGVCCEKQ